MKDERAFSLPGGEGGRREAPDGWGTRPGGRPTSPLPLRLARDLRKRLTPQEAKLWVALRNLRPAGFHFRHQVPIGRCIVDFACLKHRIVIEVDGGQHTEERAVAADGVRDDALKALGFAVLRFWNDDVNRHLRSVMDTIYAQLSTSSRFPSSEGGGCKPEGPDGGGRSLSGERTPPPVSGLRPEPPSPPGREKPRSTDQ